MRKSTLADVSKRKWEEPERERERFLDTRVLYDHFTLIPTSVAFKAVKSSSTAPGK